MKEILLSDYPMPDTKAIECALINGVLNDTQYLGELQRIVRPDMFYIPENRKIWEVITDMYQKGQRIDPITIYEKVDAVYLVDNIYKADTTFGDGVLQLGASLLGAYIKKMAYINAVNTLQGIKDGESSEKIYSRFSTFAKEMEDKLRDDNLHSAIESAKSLEEDVKGGKVSRVGTSFSTLDYLLYGGLACGNLIILAARPSVGKTTIALQMAQTAARNGKRSLYVSLEMTAKELVQRLIVGTGEVTTLDIVTGNVDWQKFAKAVNMTLSENLLVNDRARTLEEIRTRISIETKRHNCDIAFVDYLGLISHDDRRKSLAQNIGDITGTLKAVAKDCNIPVVLLCQLNRESAKDMRSPQLFDLRDSGAIEQDADVVIMLERPRDEQGNTLEGCIDMWVRKNRNGRVTFDEAIHLRGNDNYSEFKEEQRQQTQPVREVVPFPQHETEDDPF